MRGYQIAWMRTHDSHWIGVVQIGVLSDNEMSSVTMTLWLAPEHVPARPAGRFLRESVPAPTSVSAVVVVLDHPTRR